MKTQTCQYANGTCPDCGFCDVAEDLWNQEQEDALAHFHEWVDQAFPKILGIPGEYFHGEQNCHVEDYWQYRMTWVYQTVAPGYGGASEFPF